jgi:hypothetical protein
MNVGASVFQFLDDGRQRLRTVDQYLDGVARSRRGCSVSPSARRRIECAVPAETAEPASMVTKHLVGDLPAEPPVDAVSIKWLTTRQRA